MEKMEYRFACPSNMVSYDSNRQPLYTFIARPSKLASPVAATQLESSRSEPMQRNRSALAQFERNHFTGL